MMIGVKMFNILTKEYALNNLDDFLCQYSEDGRFVLYDDSFEPESFTASEKLNGMKTLFFADLSFDEWIGNMLKEQFESSGIEDNLIDEAVDYGIRNFKVLLEICGEEHKLYNQEVVDILRRISVFTLTGELGENFSTAKKFNEFAHKIMPRVVNKIESMELPTEEILKISIICGLSGLDLKGATAAASSHENDGIPMGDLMELKLEDAAEIYFERLLEEYRNRNFAIFHFDQLLHGIETKKHFNLVWMTDDIIESYLDLIVVERLLSSYDLSITLIPKNGCFGNDASIDDINRMLSPALKEFQEEGRFRLCNRGPLMAAANLKKLSKENASEIVNSDALLLKGCRISEMFNGGINAHVYVAYSIVRKVSEKVTGFSAESQISLLFHLNPGEYAFWGVRGCDDIFKMGHSFSSVKDHFSSEYSVNAIIERFNSIKSLIGEYTCDLRPIYQELDLITDKIVEMNTDNYDNVASCYSSLERRNYEKNEGKKWNMLLDKIQDVYGTSDEIKLLDVGVGDGKGIHYAHDIGMDVWGCDVSDEFINIAKDQLPDEYKDRIKKCDMRWLCFEDESFQIVRHNATLLHMPLIGRGYGADKAISESNRVLKTGGLLYLSVKIGDSNGICCIDTHEGLGDRIYQLYNKNDIEKLLSDNGFNIIDTDNFIEKRSENQQIEWYNVIAQKCDVL